mmetsp:Transcript_107197/g.277337  ORF Transcript_107197/g.277337 Transcript_107197/m.277337 type:complete len:471 (-) Transcript_107197:33-1445(-)
MVEMLLAYLRLDPPKRQAVMTLVSDFEIGERGYSIANTDVNQAIAEAAEQGLQVQQKEALAVLLRWRYLGAVDRFRIYPRLSLLRHSCAADGEFQYDGQTGMGTLSARTSVNPQWWIGSWMLEDESLFWKGANVRSAALQKAGLLTQECCCPRCHGSDAVRAIKCPGCTDYQKRLKAAKLLMLMSSSAVLMATFVGWGRVTLDHVNLKQQGEVHRNGKLKRWRCTVCDFNASDVAVDGYIKIEMQLSEDLADLSAIPTDKLGEWLSVVGSRLGMQHWLCPALCMEIYRRHTVDSQGAKTFTFTAALAGLRVGEWFLSRKLSKPPQSVIDEVADMMINTLEFIQGRLVGIRDLRVVYLRAHDMIRNLMESFDKRLLDRLRPFSGAAQNIKRRCAFCHKFLQEDIQLPDCAEDISATDEGIVPLYCVHCMTLCYCDMGCQMSDWKRHRHYCIPMEADFLSTKLSSILLGSDS